MCGGQRSRGRDDFVTRFSLTPVLHTSSGTMKEDDDDGDYGPDPFDDSTSQKRSIRGTKWLIWLSKAPNLSPSHQKLVIIVVKQEVNAIAPQRAHGVLSARRVELVCRSSFEHEVWVYLKS